ncbi:MAG: Sulfur acceptor protein CsdE [Chlamydiae bacterium]|nr:Sulfur acceptor protein CsdE [Chlamydiota bacterium]
MHESCLDNQQQIKALFSDCASADEKYRLIMSLGKELPTMPLEQRTQENIVDGCQSILYLHSTLSEGNLYFTGFSEALISYGLAALLIKAYGGQPPATLIQCPPHFIEELGLNSSLSPGRSNGLASMFLRMQQDALKFLVATQ